MKLFLIFIFLSISILMTAQSHAYLPIFSFPVFDQSNGITEVFYEKENDSKVSITVVFKDEDHPCCFVDKLYDAYRYFKYGRVEDIETFYLLLKNDGSVSVVEFPGVFSGSHKFKDTQNLHSSASFTADEMTFINERPVIYVNTWNHMFGIEPSFDKTKEIILYKYPLSTGTREDAEKKYSWFY